LIQFGRDDAIQRTTLPHYILLCEEVSDEDTHYVIGVKCIYQHFHTLQPENQGEARRVSSKLFFLSLLLLVDKVGTLGQDISWHLVGGY